MVEQPILRFDVVDVFGSGPFTGNQLAVVHGAGDLDDEQLLTIAGEFGFSETTFPTVTGPDRYDVRIFTPAGEIPFAGHPTLGTAYALRKRGLIDGEVLTQVCGVGEVLVREVAGMLTFSARPGYVGKALSDDVRNELLDLVGLDPDVADGPALVAGTGLDWVHLRVRPDAVPKARAFYTSIAGIVPGGVHGIAVVGVDGARVFSRVFSDDGTGEDAATGSAAAGLGLALHEAGDLPSHGAFEISQGVELGRPSRLLVRVESHDGEPTLVHVAGQVAGAMTGTIVVPAAG